MTAVNCTNNSTKLEIPENFEEEEDNSEDNDIDDDVFIRDGRNGFRKDTDGAKKPLMAPRKKPLRNGKLYTEIHPSPPLRVLCAPITYGLIALAMLLGVIALVVFLIKHFAAPLAILAFWKQSPTTHEVFVPCTHVHVEDVWIQSFPKLVTESAIRMVHLNDDSVLDVVLGFGSGADGFQVPKFVCDIYFGGQHPCFGGVLALDGKSGKTLWKHWTAHEVFALNCNNDFDNDGVKDCLAGGRAGVLDCVSGKDGSLYWRFPKSESEIMNIYTAQVIRDLDGDGTLDVLAIYGGDPLAEPGSDNRLSGRVLLVSGKSGSVLSWSVTPDGEESYYSPELLVHPDGTEYVLFGTGGETNPGALYVITLTNLFQGHMNKAHAIYVDDSKGVMVPPVLVDINHDGIQDIVMAMFNSSLVAFDGYTFKQIWNYTFDGAETYSTPAVGFFDSDDVPDFMVKYNYGPGFPQYYYAETTVISGRKGVPILPNPIHQSISTQASPLTVSFEGKGNDIFLFWTSDCQGFEGKEDQFEFSKGSNVHEQSRADFCRIRYNARQVNRIYALSNSMELPGVEVYNSIDRREIEYRNYTNTSALGEEYLQTHPDIYEFYKKLEGNIETPVDIQNPNNNWDGESEMTENVRYPSIHNVQKHGKYLPPQKTWQNFKDGFSPEYSGSSFFDTLPIPIDDNLPIPIDDNLPIDDEDNEDESIRWNRQERHVGPHDHGGTQRLISTGTLAPPLSGSASNHTIDYIFATYWFFPSKTQAILPKDSECVRKQLELKKKLRSELNSKLYTYDDDTLFEVAVAECIGNRNDEKSEGLYESQDGYDPFRIKMGQMTVYRVSLTFTRHDNGTNDDVQCAHILPWDEQRWAAYMGTRGDSYIQQKSP